MNRLAIILACLSLTPASAEDWIGLEDVSPVLLGIDIGQDEAGDNSGALLLGVPLGESAGFDGYYGKTSLSQDDQDFDSFALASSIWIQLNHLIEVEIRHFFEGNEGELEKETLGLAMNLQNGAWNFRILLEDGDLMIFTNDDINDFLSNLIPDRLESDVDVYGLALGWQDGSWYWQTSYQMFDYEADLSRLEQSRFIDFLIKPSALVQSSLLIENNTSILIGHSDLDDDYAVWFSKDRSAVDEETIDYLILSWQHWQSSEFGYLLSAAMPLPADELGISLGLRWAL